MESKRFLQVGVRIFHICYRNGSDFLVVLELCPDLIRECGVGLRRLGKEEKR